jgi:Xaa-Pro aminopeptidase
MVLVDIGASYGGYAADITRTWPSSGTFTAEQRKVYDTVLAVQNKIIAAIRPGISLDRQHKMAEAELTRAGYSLPHYIGHFVGLEVHDVGNAGAPLEAGMVITVEPGIYLKGKFGVRIEDMVLVTSKGGRVMTKALPRKASAVEAWMKKVRAGK